MTAWHWQERYDVEDPETAHRVQLLQIEKQIPFTKWLEQKKRHTANQCHANTSKEEADEIELKRNECERRFMQWVRNKQREKTTKTGAAARESGSTAPDKARKATKSDDPFVKPPSLHTNPRIKRTRGDQKAASGVAVRKKKTSTSLKQQQQQQQCAAAYKEWERRKLREDGVKRKHKQLNEQLQEHAQKLRHLTIWQKKDVVCAYSTNRRVSNSLPPPTNPNKSFAA